MLRHVLTPKNKSFICSRLTLADHMINTHRPFAASYIPIINTFNVILADTVIFILENITTPVPHMYIYIYIYYADVSLEMYLHM